MGPQLSCLVPQVTNPFASNLLTALASHNSSPTKMHRFPIPNTPPELYDHIIMPYNASTFALELTRCNLWDLYPFLAEYLTIGFPLGNMPILCESIIIPNHSSFHKHPNVVWDYIREEAAANHMSGPFSKVEMETIMRCFFFCLPFIVSSRTNPRSRQTCQISCLP